GLICSAKSSGENSVAAAARRRFGHEFADIIVSAGVAGIYAGRPSELSLSACFPRVSKWDRQIHSPMLIAVSRHLARQKKSSERRGMISFAGGLGDLAEAIAGRLGTSVLCDHTVESVQLAPFPVIHCNFKGKARTIRASHVLLAVSAPKARRMLGKC